MTPTCTFILPYGPTAKRHRQVTEQRTADFVASCKCCIRRASSKEEERNVGDQVDDGTSSTLAAETKNTCRNYRSLQIHTCSYSEHRVSIHSSAKMSNSLMTVLSPYFQLRRGRVPLVCRKSLVVGL
jgi:hypothetical protein